MKHVYHISRNHRLLTIWSGDSKGKRTSVRTQKPNAGTTLEQRHAMFTATLKEYGIKLPALDQVGGWMQVIRK